MAAYAAGVWTRVAISHDGWGVAVGNQEETDSNGRATLYQRSVIDVGPGGCVNCILPPGTTFYSAPDPVPAHCRECR